GTVGYPGYPFYMAGSYWWGCCHFGGGDPLAASEFCGESGAFWDIAWLLGYISTDEYHDSQEYWACSNAVGNFDDPVWKPMTGCLGFGDHEGYSHEYTQTHIIPPELYAAVGYGEPPVIPCTMPMGFVDGHVKYMRLGFYQMISLLTSPNELQ
ncbi:MAG: hypothetical protein JSV65_00760, partial [Armatimonadota bacterium]